MNKTKVKHKYKLKQVKAIKRERQELIIMNHLYKISFNGLLIQGIMVTKISIKI